jgi:hypothetical protein
MRNSMGLKFFKMFKRLLRIVKRCTSKMEHDTFQAFSLAICLGVFNQIWHNGIIKQCTIMSNAFGYISQTLNSVDGPNHWNQALFNVKSLLHSFGRFISWWRAYYFMQIFKIELGLVACYYMTKVAPLIIFNHLEQFRRKFHSFHLSIAVERVRNPA